MQLTKDRYARLKRAAAQGMAARVSAREKTEDHSMVTTHEILAEYLHGREYRSELTRGLAAAAKAAGLVVIYGASDDLLVFEGAIDDEVGACRGTTVYIIANGEVSATPAPGAVRINAEWCPKCHCVCPAAKEQARAALALAKGGSDD